MSRPDRGSFEQLVEHGDRTVPIVRPPLRFVTSGHQCGKTFTAKRMADAARRERLKAKLRAAGPFLVLLAGLGCLSVSVWPEVLPTVGCALFALSTVWSLLRCVR